VLLQPHDAGRLLIENLIDDLDFKEMVARAERAALIGATSQGAFADPIGIGAVQEAVGLRMLDVVGRAEVPLFNDIARSQSEELLQLFRIEVKATLLARAGGNLAEQFLDQRADMRLDLAVEQVGA